MTIERTSALRSTRRPVLVHPPRHKLELVNVLHALADPTRLTIVQTLSLEPERACGTFPVSVAPSTLTHHFRVLREAGVIRQREDGNRRWTSLRKDDIDARFPGVLETVLQAAPKPPAKRSRERVPSPRALTAG
jgi:DNA-binding transcriptional ArsR family regulator